MAIKSIKELSGRKRPGKRQIESAKKTKAIPKQGKSVGRTKGRLEYGFGKIKKEEVAGVVKGFRQKFKTDFGAILKDTDGNIIARTHIAKGNTTIPEQLVVKALSKYGKKYDEVELVLSVPDKKKGRVKSSKKTTKKIPLKKPTKKPAKKLTKKISKATKTPSKKITGKKTLKHSIKSGKSGTKKSKKK
jgi:hypothetical protein